MEIAAHQGQKKHSFTSTNNTGRVDNTEVTQANRKRRTAMGFGMSGMNQMSSTINGIPRMKFNKKKLSNNKQINMTQNEI